MTGRTERASDDGGADEPEPPAPAPCSKFIGVSWCRSSECWEASLPPGFPARLMPAGHPENLKPSGLPPPGGRRLPPGQAGGSKRVDLGFLQDEEAAARRYDEAAETVGGRLNFVAAEAEAESEAEAEGAAENFAERTYLTAVLLKGAL